MLNNGTVKQTNFTYLCTCTNNKTIVLMLFYFFLCFSLQSHFVFVFQEKESIAKCIADLKVLAKATQARAAV